MSSVVLDASFIVKLLIQEPNSILCQAVFESYRGAKDEMLVPGHAAGEVLEVIRRKCSSGMATEKQLTRSVDVLRALARPVSVDELASRACAIALAEGLTIYDALYVALADRESAILLTCDIKLVEKLRASPFKDLLFGVGEAGFVYHGSR